MQHYETLIFVIYDGIQNSIFESQILNPLIKQKKLNPLLNVILISFEPQDVSLQNMQKIIDQNINIYIYKRWPFICKEALWFEIRYLKKILNNISSYILKARGPIAGYIAIQARTQTCKKIIIQARGLLTEEYKYVHNHIKNRYKQIIHYWRARSYLSIEKNVYRQSYDIEAISEPLKDYLIKEFYTQKKLVSITQDDIPEKINPIIKQRWRQHIRNALSIQDSASVYIYCGSAHSWQCPEETILFFKEQLYKDPNTILIILSRDQTIFFNLLKKHQVISKYYRLLFVRNNMVFKYICAADYGLLFRKNHIINCVARPTKLLEYQACDIRIYYQYLQ